MKYAFSLIVGLTLGTFCALALIYFNPLTRSQVEQDPGSGWALEYKLAAENTWLSTHDNRIELPVVPKATQLLWEDGVRGSWLAAMPLEGAPGQRPAAATRISMPTSQSDFVHKGLLVEDFWLISVAGAGTLLVHGFSNQWPLVRDTLVRVDLLRREFVGPATYSATRGPGDGHADVIGMTGDYHSARGRAHERVSLESYDGSLASASGRLLIELADDGV